MNEICPWVMYTRVSETRTPYMPGTAVLGTQDRAVAEMSVCLHSFLWMVMEGDR